MKKLFAFVLSFILNFFLTLNIFAEVKVVNPESGVWANTQYLVLDVEAGDEAYYSINGSDPLIAGFAYDGPVLLDMTGTVELRVASISSDGSQSQISIHYAVTPSTPKDKEAANFVKKYHDGISYKAGERLKIPNAFSYSLGTNYESFLPAQEIFYSSDCVLSRFIPCVLSTEDAKWRFVIYTSPAKKGSFTRRSVPFKIDNWETITFTDKNLIYRIDDEYWAAPKSPVIIDRRVPHTISWQSMEVLPGNPVESFVLPPRPDFSISKATDGALSVSLDTESDYSFSINYEAELFKSTTIDTFWGDEIFGRLKLGVYYNAVFQGYDYVSYAVDKKRPEKPVIYSSSGTFFSRNAVDLSFSSKEDASLYVSVSEPLILVGNISNEEKEKLFETAKATDFVQVSDKINLDSPSFDAVYYKVIAYFVDDSGNKSDESSYDVIIDKYNYFVDAKNGTEGADGSSEFPFASFDDCLSMLKTVSFANITVIGKLELSEGEHVISSNCTIRGKDDGRLILPSGASLVVRSATLEIIDCIIERNDLEKESSGSVFINLEHALLSVSNCELSVQFAKNGTLIQANSSSVMIKESGLYSSAVFYSSCISAIDTKVYVIDSRVSSSANTAVNFSAQSCEFFLDSCACKITGVYGRAVELFNTQSSIKKNNFSAELSSSKGKSDALFVDAKTLTLEYSENSFRGF